MRPSGLTSTLIQVPVRVSSFTVCACPGGWLTFQGGGEEAALAGGGGFWARAIEPNRLQDRAMQTARGNKDMDSLPRVGIGLAVAKA